MRVVAREVSPWMERRPRRCDPLQCVICRTALELRRVSRFQMASFASVGTTQRRKRVEVVVPLFLKDRADCALAAVGSFALDMREASGFGRGRTALCTRTLVLKRSSKSH